MLGHLANTFRLQVRSHQDENATQLLQDYEVWFRENNLAALLSERIATTDERKNKRKSQSSHDEPYLQPPAKRSCRVKKPAATPPPLAELPNYLDPRLMEPVLVPVTPKTTSRRPKRSCMTKTPLNEEQLNSLFLDEDDEANPKRNEDALTEAEKQRSDEMSRLKGILWPGMDIFDSATGQMRRKRNQKKDGTVVRRMQTTSLMVAPTEQIFSPEGNLLKERYISGDVDENQTPLKGETPIPKQRPSRSRQRRPLAQNDPNLPIEQRVRKKAAVGTSKKREPVQSVATPRRRPQRPTVIKPPYAEDDLDFQISLQAFEKCKKGPRGGFRIFADPENEARDAFKGYQPSKQHPTQETLTPARLILDHRGNIPKNPGRKGDGRDMQEKENIEPILNPHGYMGMSDWDSPLAKRTGTKQPNYPPEFFFVKDEGEDEGKCSFQCNPLIAPTFRSGGMGLLGDGCYDDFSVAGASWNMHRAQSSEATISEEDHQELARLYLAGGAD
ncbi:unnamed protein product [Penicillium manginii]